MPNIGVLPISLRDLADCAGQRLGVARAVREEHAIRFQREHVFGRGEGGNDSDAAAEMDQVAKNVALDAEIVSDDVQGLLRPDRPFV